MWSVSILKITVVPDKNHSSRIFTASIIFLPSLVRGYICDEKAEQVCCPEYMGQFNNTITNTVNTIYAINRDTIMVRSNIEQSRWRNIEAFFWRNESCFPWLGRFYICNLSCHLPTLISEYQEQLDYNDIDEDDDSFEETKMLLPGTLTVEDIRWENVSMLKGGSIVLCF